jgi:catechol 2,3-dioxygenase-like lactoylglutathione lyase family enzyme
MAVAIQITFDCADPDRLAHFWADVLGYELDTPPAGYDSWEAWLTERGVPESEWNRASAVSDPDGHGPRIYFQRVPEPKERKNRVHLDVNAAGPPAAGRTTNGAPPSMLRSSAPSDSGRRRSASSRRWVSATTSCRTSKATSSACNSRVACVA